MHVPEQISAAAPVSAAGAARAWPVRYRLIGLTFALSMLLYVDRVAISTARGPITSELGLSDTQFGSVLSAFALGYALFQAPGGLLADRYGARLALTSVVRREDRRRVRTADLDWFAGAVLRARRNAQRRRGNSVALGPSRSAGRGSAAFVRQRNGRANSLVSEPFSERQRRTTL
jgi:MFS family permease